jgi:hypothetical protein
LISLLVRYQLEQRAFIPICEPNSGQSMSPIANDRATIAKIADLDQKITNT